jgi:hypothetical protein
MSLAGEGAAVMWHEARPEARADYYEWHNREHMPERLGIPGFRRGRRYIAVDGQLKFFILYETDALATLTGADYQLRLNNPSPWTRRNSALLMNASRSLCRVAATHGTGQGGYIMTLRYDVAEGCEEEHRRLLVHRILPALADRPGISGAHLLIADREASGIQTAEKKLRTQQSLVPGRIILVEGGGDADALQSACNDTLTDDVLNAAGDAVQLQRDLYRLQYSRCKTAGAVG